MTDNSSRTTTAMTIGAGVCAAAFVGYCIYFDHKRRSAPDYKKKLREKRRSEKKANKEAKQTPMPNFKNPEAMQRFFLQEVQLGEELLGQGDIENGVEHLSNAIAVCAQPQQLLQVLQQSLPPQVFALLMEKLPTVSKRMSRNASSSDMLLEEDVE